MLCAMITLLDTIQHEDGYPMSIVECGGRYYLQYSSGADASEFVNIDGRWYLTNLAESIKKIEDRACAALRRAIKRERQLNRGDYSGKS